MTSPPDAHQKPTEGEKNTQKSDDTKQAKDKLEAAKRREEQEKKKKDNPPGGSDKSAGGGQQSTKT
ncbi:hypothetical protein MMC32_003891 [Xylographa parallela]|nr:hypothetical protein [Xylographa parallela]